MSLTIVTSHWKEDLTWLLKAKFPVVLIDKEGADPSPFVPQHVIPNLGRECTSYLKYIIENYDNLPEAIAFIHGHETSSHQQHERPLLEVIEGINWEKYGFVPINNMHYPSSFEDSENIRLFTFFDQLCIPLRRGERPWEGGPMIHELGGQFVVRRDKILENPKMLYEGWYYIFMNTPGFDVEFSYILERSWHVVFGEEMVQMPKKDWFSFDWVPKRVKWNDAGEFTPILMK